jgi:hypothetical protein
VVRNLTFGATDMKDTSKESMNYQNKIALIVEI